MTRNSVRRRFRNRFQLRHARMCNRRIRGDFGSGLFRGRRSGFGLCDVLGPSFFCSVRSVVECKITDLLVCRKGVKALYTFEGLS